MTPGANDLTVLALLHAIFERSSLLMEVGIAGLLRRRLERGGVTHPQAAIFAVPNKKGESWRTRS